MNPKLVRMLKAIFLEKEEMLKRLETNTHTKEDAELFREMVEVVSLFSEKELSGKVSSKKVAKKFMAYYEKKTP